MPPSSRRALLPSRTMRECRRGSRPPRAGVPPPRPFRCRRPSPTQPCPSPSSLIPSPCLSSPGAPVSGPAGSAELPANAGRVCWRGPCPSDTSGCNCIPFRLHMKLSLESPSPLRVSWESAVSRGQDGELGLNGGAEKQHLVVKPPSSRPSGHYRIAQRKVVGRFRTRSGGSLAHSLVVSDAAAWEPFFQVAKPEDVPDLDLGTSGMAARRRRS